LVPEAAKSDSAMKRLAELRKTAKVGDVTSPAGAAWTGDRDHL
jgi:hypothetical protein